MVGKAAQMRRYAALLLGTRPLLRGWLRDPAVQAAIEDETVDVSRMAETLNSFESSNPFTDGGVGLLVERAGWPIGLIHLIWINWVSRNAEVILLVGPSESGRSLSAAAVLEKVGHTAFRELNLHKLYASVYAPNEAAVSVFRRVMKEEAWFRAYVNSPEAKDDVHFSGLLASECHATMRRYERRY